MTDHPASVALPGELLDYLAARDQQRQRAVHRRWSALSRREQRLVREAAVMGYVQGVRSQPGGHNATIPPDSAIVALVIDACASMSDLYPTIYRAGSRRHA